MPFQFTCEQCGKSFIRPCRRTPNQPSRYCSRACQFAPRAGIFQDDGTVLVALTQGRFAIIDGADAERVLAFNWAYSSGYAGRDFGGRGRKKSVALHRWLMGTPDGMDTDHINGNKLDNRRSNLRVCTRAQNAQNRHAQTNNRSCQFKGVNLHKNGSWRMHIQVSGFSTSEEAARAYDRVARMFHGEFANLNFPDE